MHPVGDACIRLRSGDEELDKMFSFLKADPKNKLEKEYQAKLKQARDLQRQGDVVGSAKLVAEAEELRKRLEAFES